MRGTLPELAEAIRKRGASRGESTVVVEGNRADRAEASARVDEVEIDSRIREALAAGATVKALSREIARSSRRPAREIYARALALRARETGAGRRKAGV